MDYSFSDSTKRAKYLTLERAREESNLNEEELRRAVTAGSLSTAEIGSSVFIERESLAHFLSKEKEKSHGHKRDMASFIPNVSYRSDDTFDENNTINPKEKTIFTEALLKDREMAARLSPAPLVSVTALLVISFILSLPSGVYTGKAVDPGAEAFFKTETIKKATFENITSLLARSHEAEERLAMNISQENQNTARQTVTSDYSESAFALGAWFGSVTKALNVLAVGVYHSINGLFN